MVLHLPRSASARNTQFSPRSTFTKCPEIDNFFLYGETDHFTLKEESSHNVKVKIILSHWPLISLKTFLFIYSLKKGILLGNIVKIMRKIENNKVF